MIFNKLLFFSVLIGATTFSIGQVKDSKCKAFIDGYPAQYEGDCKNGLANGKGKTIGKAFYEGEFKKGKPHGNGKFTWENGNYYSGKWVKGIKEGAGELVIKRSFKSDSTVTGYWKDDAYIGKEATEWKVIRKQGVTRFQIRQISEDGNNDIQIDFRRNGSKLGGWSNLQLIGDGLEKQNNPPYGFNYPTFPFNGRVSMTVPFQFNPNSFEVVFEYVIYRPGSWLITLNVN